MESKNNKEPRSILRQAQQPEYRDICVRRGCGNAAKSTKPSSPQQATEYSGSPNKVKRISISKFGGNGFIGRLLKITGPILDLIMGINKINSIYRKTVEPGLNKEQFVSKLLKILKVRYHIPEQDLERIPVEGSLIVVVNHPYGGLEGVILAKLLSSIRSDIKIMANIGLKVFPELEDFFIFTNPLKTHNPKNVKSIQNCRKHLENKGLLLFFPAGKVAYYRKEKKRVTDGDWNRIAAHLSINLNVPVLPLFVSGHNSRLFLFMGRIYYRFKLLMLPGEFAKKKKNTVEIRAGFPMTASTLKKKGKSGDITNFLRICTYVLDPGVGSYTDKIEEKSITLPSMPPLLKRTDKILMSAEIKLLPESQHLVDYKEFSVYYGFKAQMENIVKEITILREKTFREFNEGSGQPCDTDRFDETYTQLFIWDNDHDEIIGAYRMGQTDIIKERYLSHIFQFDVLFKKETTPSLEMGRSFIVSEHQKSFYGLFLLWRGIGEFAVRYPRYRKLYGTVSLSNIYNRRSISLIDKILTSETATVTARSPFKSLIHPELNDYLKKYVLDFKDLSLLVKSTESDGKDLPILLKQYWKLGAKFQTTAVDTNFLETPGLLLIVDLPNTPGSNLKMYLEDGMEAYINYE